MTEEQESHHKDSEELDGYDLDEITLIDPDNPEGLPEEIDLDTEIIVE
ncbi:MAG: hypothetical protein OEV64_04940 [Desulfobulbaceae bacterium]|nr:hypothetical protein [Desulfobulbaceae bacterium]